MARFLPFRSARAPPAGTLPGGIPERGAERKRVYPLESVSTVQFSAILRSRAARLGILAMGVAGLVSLLREPAVAGDTPVPVGPAAIRVSSPAPANPATPMQPAPAPGAVAATATRPAPDPTVLGSTTPGGKLSRGHTPPSWPAGPAPLPGSILPEHRIVAFYGNPYSKRMGVLGELPPDSMMAQLRATAAAWAAADSTLKVQPALHLIATVAQGQPGRDGMHRLRMPSSLIEQVAGWAESNGWLLFLDVQVGHSTVQKELPRLLPYLARPYVHLALDPEFSMKDETAPGRRIGTMDAEDVNFAMRTLGGLVDSLKLPPKVLVVHRFTQRMLTHYDRIALDPRVQLVIDMDGFGDRPLKRSVYRDFIVKEPVQFTGFKLFYKNDKPMMTFDEVLSLSPQPVYIQYQ